MRRALPVLIAAWASTVGLADDSHLKTLWERYTTESTRVKPADARQFHERWKADFLGALSRSPESPMADRVLREVVALCNATDDLDLSITLSRQLLTRRESPWWKGRWHTEIASLYKLKSFADPDAGYAEQAIQHFRDANSAYMNAIRDGKSVNFYAGQIVMNLAAIARLQENLGKDPSLIAEPLSEARRTIARFGLDRAGDLHGYDSEYLAGKEMLVWLAGGDVDKAETLLEVATRHASRRWKAYYIVTFAEEAYADDAQRFDDFLARWQARVDQPESEAILLFHRGWTPYVKHRNAQKSAALLGQLVADYSDVLLQLENEPDDLRSRRLYAETLFILHAAYLDVGNVQGARDTIARFLKLYPRDRRAAALKRIDARLASEASEEPHTSLVSPDRAPVTRLMLVTALNIGFVVVTVLVLTIRRSRAKTKRVSDTTE